MQTKTTRTYRERGKKATEVERRYIITYARKLSRRDMAKNLKMALQTLTRLVKELIAEGAIPQYLPEPDAKRKPKEPTREERIKRLRAAAAKLTA